MTGGKVAVLDLGSTAEIKNVQIDIAGKTFPGLAGIEIHQQPIN